MFDEIAGKSAHLFAGIGGADEPAVVAFLHDQQDVASIQVELVALSRLVRVFGATQARHRLALLAAASLHRPLPGRTSQVATLPLVRSIQLNVRRRQRALRPLEAGCSKVALVFVWIVHEMVSGSCFVLYGPTRLASSQRSC